MTAIADLFKFFFFPFLRKILCKFYFPGVAFQSTTSMFVFMICHNQTVAASNASLSAVAGWSGHPVCGKRYHFIIENDQMAGRRRTCCLRCGTPMAAAESRWEEPAYY
jgi:hypothetical protein